MVRAMQNKLVSVALSLALGVAATSVAHAETLADVKAKGYLQCGVTNGVAGFSAPDANNVWTGLEVDFCRAVAAAVFNDASKVRFTPLTSQERFTALSAGEIDILSRTTTWTMSRDTSLGVKFVGTIYYDGQGFMVRKADGIKSALDLAGAAVCIEGDTTAQLNAADYFTTNNIQVKVSTFVGQDEAVKAYQDGRCDVYTSDASGLASERSKFATPDDHVILPEIISKEPIGPVVRKDDDQWFKINRWTYFALLEAEELGVTSANVDEMLGSDNPAVKRLLGVEGDFGAPIGLSKDWAYQIIKQVGNYGESFERNLGPATDIGLERGLNALWTHGGLQYAAPIR